MPESGYPVYDMTIRPGDRFLLYTDGAIEPENSSGVPFGDCKLDQVVRNIASRSASELVDQILLEIRGWQPTATAGAGRHHAHRARRQLGLRSRPLEKSRLAVFNQNHAPTAKALASNGVRRVS